MNFDITEEAAREAQIQLNKRGTPDAFLRLGVKGSGCSGFSYIIEFEDNMPRNKDNVFNLKGIKILIDTKSMIYLNNSILDYEKTLMKSGFKFINPNVKSSCRVWRICRILIAKLN